MQTIGSLKPEVSKYLRSPAVFQYKIYKLKYLKLDYVQRAQPSVKAKYDPSF